MSAALTDDEQQEVDCANATGRRAVVFLHGLWLLPSSWGRWSERFAQDGYATLTPGWPDEEQPSSSMASDLRLIGGVRIAAVASHYAKVIAQLNRKPVVIGHSFGGLVAQMLAGRGLAKATVAIEPAPFRGVLPLPAPALRSVIKRPHNRSRAVPLSYAQFAQLFANALEEAEARALFEQFVVPAPGGPLFQAAAANINPRTEVTVNTRTATRGPLLIISGQKDQMFPPAVADACYQRQCRNRQVTEMIEIPDRGHSITVDHGWRQAADAAFAFVERFTSPF